jgi:hypothetical protein
MHPAASFLVTAGIGGIALFVAATLVIGFRRATGTRGLAFGAAILGWLALLATLASAGVLHRWESRPPPIFVMLLTAFVVTVVVARGAIGSKLARGLPLAALVGFHAFRLPLELVMHSAANEGTMPVQMSFSGWNFDILTGASAIVVAWLVARGTAPRWVVTTWAIVSSLLLLAIVSIAIASTPLFAAFGRTPDRLATWIGYFPFVWLPGVLVPAALLGQIVLFRRLAADARDG